MYKPKGSMGLGVTQSALHAVSESDLKKLLYKTTSGDSAKGGSVGLEEDARAVNFLDVHGMGTRDTKYMKLQVKTAPLLGRTACSSSATFTAHPLDQASMNSDYAKSKKKLGQTLNPAGQGFMDFKEIKSDYMSTHTPFSPEQMRVAKSPNFKAKDPRTRTLTSITDMMEVRPRSHGDFCHHNTEGLLKTGVIVLGSKGKAAPRGNLYYEGGFDAELPKTEYQQFGLARGRSLPSFTFTESFNPRRKFSQLPQYCPGLAAGPPTTLVVGGDD
jgi:hypothetical protein